MSRWRNSPPRPKLVITVKTPALLFAIAFLPLVSARGQGTIRATTRVLPDGSTLTAVTNPDTRTREETIAETSGKVLRKTIYTLNEQNFATGATHLDAKGGVRYKEVYSFDYSGRITESKLFTGDDRPLGRRVFVYEGKNQAHIDDYDANGILLTQARKAGAGRSGQPEVRRAIPVR
jgi:hypothetical protein